MRERPISGTYYRCEACLRISNWLGDPGSCPACGGSRMESVDVTPRGEVDALRARAEQAERERELLRHVVTRYRAMLFPLSRADRIEKEDDR